MSAVDALPGPLREALAPFQQLLGRPAASTETADAPPTTERGGQPRGTPPTRREIADTYQRGPSFARYIPIVEYLPDSECFLLEDGVSVGVAAEVMPIATEGRSQDNLASVRDQIEAACQDTLPEYDRRPWVVQLFAADDTDPRPASRTLRAYAADHLADDHFTQRWLDGMDAHLRSIGQPGGLFHDDQVTGTAWRGQTRRTRLVLYRWQGSETEPGDAEANRVYDRLAAALEGAGLRLLRMDGEAMHAWLLRWFNPAPATLPDEPDFHDRVRYPGDAAVAELADYDFGEDVVHNCPHVDVESGLWYFDGQPHRIVPVEDLRRPPDIGHITGELSRAGGQSYNAVMDRLPEDVTMAITVVAIPQEPLEDHINQLKNKAHGDSVHASAVRADCDEAREMLKDQHKLYRASIAFYVRGNDHADLARRTLRLTSQLQQAHLRPVDPADEIAPANTYLRWLPMAFDPALDKQTWYTRLTYVQHLANLAPFFERSRGTGRPGLSFFNRGGATFNFDPLSLADRTKNGHMLIFGPTGAGKSATLNAMFSQLQALRRPRLFILEVGNSFGLLADDFARQGLSVNKVRLAPGVAPPLPLFADAHRLLGQAGRKRHEFRSTADDEPAPIDDDDDETGDGERDLLGEMEITARMMITGGDAEEEHNFRRADQRLVRDAIFAAARTATDADRTCLAEDVRDALSAIGRDDNRTAERRNKAQHMADSMGLFCDGFDGQVFNRAGRAWPEADVTVVDLAHYSRDGYEAQLALSVISLTNIIIGIAERDQYTGRPIIQAIDECHVVTVNPLLSPYLVKAGKMGRKLSYWLWLATQNLEDFPDAATRLLNMVEWIVCLAPPEDEIEQLSRFRRLSDDQKALLRSATKGQGKYTEGVVLADRIEALFRIVPQSRYLALAGTEGEEKAERKAVMDADNCSELDAALTIAAQMDEKRGITTQPTEEAAHRV